MLLHRPPLLRASEAGFAAGEGLFGECSGAQFAVIFMRWLTGESLRKEGSCALSEDAVGEVASGDGNGMERNMDGEEGGTGGGDDEREEECEEDEEVAPLDDDGTR